MTQGNLRRHPGDCRYERDRFTAGAGRVSAVALALLASASIASPAFAADSPARQAAIASARAALWASPEQSFAVKGDAFTVKDVILDKDGGAHVRFDRAHEGIPVVAGDLVVHLKPGGSLRSVTAAQTAPVTDSSVPQRTKSTAQASAESRFGNPARTVAGSTLVYDASNGTPRLAYEVVLRSGIGPVPERIHVRTDADTGKELRVWDETEKAVGTGYTQYSGTQTLYTTAVTGGYNLSTNVLAPGSVCMIGMGSCNDIVDADNVWGNGTTSDPNTKAADASFGLNSTFEFLDSWFGRADVYGDGTPIRVAVGAGAFDNAVNGLRDPDSGVATIVLGDGTSGRPWSSLDIVAHEVGHSLTEATAKLDSSAEAEALNESASDVLAALTEFYALGSHPDNYTLGEDLSPTHTPRRWMAQPSLDGTSPDCWSSSVGTLFPHQAAGLGNKFFFMLLHGSAGGTYGTAPTCGARPVDGVGIWDAGNIWYRALTVYMTSTTDYKAVGSNDARAATLAAATDLYGTCSKEYKAVQAAWTATNVAGEDATCPLVLEPALGTPATRSLTTDPTFGTAVDWIHWKNSLSSNFDRKNATQRISTWSIVGPSGNTSSESTSPTTFSWTDAIGGTPSGSATTGTSRKLTNGRGLKFSVPIGAGEARTLRVYAGVRGTTTMGTLSASLGSGTPQTSGLAGWSTTAISNGTFTIHVEPSAATTLNVEFTQTAGGNATGSAVVLYGASLH